jgi:cellulase/cellobiase CelA1
MKGVGAFASLLASSAAVASYLAAVVRGDCSQTLPGSYASAVATYPALKAQIELVAEQQIAQWYTDRVDDTASLATQVVQTQCSSSSSYSASRPTVVVYGLPQKDCEHHFSSSGSNTDSTSYRAFLQQLADAAGTRDIIYILEPDAVGLLADNGCGNSNGYAENLAVAIEVLSANENADIYLDIGYWTLSDDDKAAKVADIVKKVDTAGKCRGIALNTSNYRSAAEMEELCARFARVAGADYRCIVDSSRNWVAPSSTEWCNVKTAGVGVLPTASTGYDHIDYFVWVKPPGESDGECSGQSADALAGPSAGTFFPEHFVQLWNDGVFVQRLGQASITGTDYSAYATVSTPASASSSSLSSSASSDAVTSEYDSATTVETPTAESGESGSVEMESKTSEIEFTSFAVLSDDSVAAGVHATSEERDAEAVEETDASDATTVINTTSTATTTTSTLAVNATTATTTSTSAMIVTAVNTTSTANASDESTNNNTERAEPAQQPETPTSC